MNRSRSHTDDGDAVMTHPELQHVLSVIDADLGGELSLKSLAAELAVSSRYFSSLFRRTLGMTPHRWVLRQRCLTAAELLAGNTPIPEIAARLGFCSHSHFTQVFRKTLGIAPSECRRSFR